MIKLNLGCGKDIKEGFVNVDLKKGTGVTLVINFNNDSLMNYYNEGTVDYILCSHMLEHLINPVDFILDCQKILKKHGILEVRLPTTLRTGLFHMRTGHTKSYFYALGCRGRGYQGYPMFDITVKGNWKHYKFKEYVFYRYINLRDWFYRQIYDEWVYKLVKK